MCDQICKYTKSAIKKIIFELVENISENSSKAKLSVFPEFYVDFIALYYIICKKESVILLCICNSWTIKEQNL